MGKEEYIGASGNICVTLKRKAEWALLYGGVYGRLNVFWKKDDAVRKWKRELVVNTFPEAKVGKIFSIQLVKEPHADILMWSGEPSGEYSVRSAYKILQISNPRAYALQTGYKDFYKKLWLLDVPTKIKVPIWKISWNYLPTRANMSASRVVVRDSARLVLLSCSEIHQRVPSAFTAEALACRKATQLGIDMQWPEIIIEGDSLSIIKKCKAKGNRNLKRKEETYLVESVPRYAKNHLENGSLREPD
ncbi:hypothetical protein CXB51_028100 [Gossypium anomalum]|uniref:RNase H type-1 domain-containing protein n=1 Tax=Gossypium anomalum TaxID=47600 RepID=A0A8J6CQ00_9ROSI|nr:hypothetical protein CXB51_028100 [Gossypium anomalum]